MLDGLFLPLFKTWGLRASTSRRVFHTPRALSPHSLGRAGNSAVAFVVTAFFSSPAIAQDMAHIGPERIPLDRHSTVTLQPSEHPGALAEVVFDNRDVNGSGDNGTYQLSIEGVSVDVVFTWSSAADSIEVITPEGFIAVPSTLDVAEGSIGTVLIFSGEWLGG